MIAQSPQLSQIVILYKVNQPNKVTVGMAIAALIFERWETCWLFATNFTVEGQ